MAAGDAFFRQSAVINQQLNSLRANRLGKANLSQRREELVFRKEQFGLRQQEFAQREESIQQSRALGVARIAADFANTASEEQKPELRNHAAAIINGIFPDGPQLPTDGAEFDVGEALAQMEVAALEGDQKLLNDLQKEMMANATPGEIARTQPSLDAARGEADLFGGKNFTPSEEAGSFEGFGTPTTTEGIDETGFFVQRKNGSIDFGVAYTMYKQNRLRNSDTGAMSNPGASPSGTQTFGATQEGPEGTTKPVDIGPELFELFEKHFTAEKKNDALRAAWKGLPVDRRAELGRAYSKAARNAVLVQNGEPPDPFTSGEDRDLRQINAYAALDQKRIDGTMTSEERTTYLRIGSDLKITSTVNPATEDEIVRRQQLGQTVDNAKRMSQAMVEAAAPLAKGQSMVQEDQLSKWTAANFVELEVLKKMPPGAKREGQLQGATQRGDKLVKAAVAATNAENITVAAEATQKALLINVEALTNENLTPGVQQDLKAMNAFLKDLQAEQFAHIEMMGARTLASYTKWQKAVVASPRRSQALNKAIERTQERGAKAQEDLDAMDADLKGNTVFESASQALKDQMLIDGVSPDRATTADVATARGNIKGDADLKGNTLFEALETVVKQQIAANGVDPDKTTGTDVATAIEQVDKKKARIAATAKAGGSETGFTAPITTPSGKAGTIRVQPDAASPTGFRAIEIPTPGGAEGDTTTLISEKGPLVQFGSAGERKSLVASKQLVAQTKDLMAEFERVGKDIVGPIDQILTKLGRPFGAIPPERLEYSAKLNTIKAQYRNDLFGSQLTKFEIADAITFLPVMEDQDADHRAKLKVMHENSVRLQKLQEESIGIRKANVGKVSDDDRLAELLDKGATYEESIQIMVEEGR